MKNEIYFFLFLISEGFEPYDDFNSLLQLISQRKHFLFLIYIIPINNLKSTFIVIPFKPVEQTPLTFLFIFHDYQKLYVIYFSALNSLSKNYLC